jgi:CheY-like chemotaxis protein
MPRSILSDEIRLSQILTNIVGNAIKFTSHGRVQVSVGWKPSEELPEYFARKRGDLLSFEVSDTGLGLSEAQAARLFQPFSQADTSYTRQFGGTGLGLALSRNLARGLGGDLILRSSQPGKGSTFLITIDPRKADKEQLFQELSFDEPLSVQDEKEEKQDDLRFALQAKKILLVEDSVDIQILFKRFLEGAGAVVTLAGNGAEGVLAAQADTYDIVLMDVQMPVKDGCEATYELRSYGYNGLIVALTAHAMKEEYDRCIQAGYDAHLSKPIRRHDLIVQLAKIVREHNHQARYSLSVQ